MAFRFAVPDSSPPPSSPDPLTPKKKHGFSFGGPEPSTTPAGPPPSSIATLTPAGAPSDGFLSSSLMRGVTGSKQPSFGLNTSSRKAARSKGFARDSGNTPLGRSIGRKALQPSNLSQQFSAMDDEDDDEDESEDAEGEEYLPADKGSVFRPAGGKSLDDIEKFLDDELEAEDEQHAYTDEESNESQDSDAGHTRSGQMDMFLNMRHDDRGYDEPMVGEEEDLMMLSQPVAADRVRKEAEDMYRRSSHFGRSRKGPNFQFASIARDLYERQDIAQLNEPPELILRTEERLCRLYDEGVGPEDDAEKMDNSLTNITNQVVTLWKDYVDELPQPEGEDIATIGPGNDEDPLIKATYIAGLILRMHHTRWDSHIEEERVAQLPEILFDWMEKEGHNLHPDQVRQLSQFRPSPICHPLYWQIVRSALLRGDSASTARLLRNAGWEHARKGPRGEKMYTGKALDNVRRFAAVTADVLDQCPATRGEWDIGNSDWTLFRIQAKGALDRLTLFAEGKDQTFDESMDDEEESMSTKARKASSQIPWDVYENLQTLYGIILGKEDDIMETAQDWCEATIGLFGWWDDGGQQYKAPRLSQSQSFRASSSKLNSSVDYFERLAAAFHIVVQSDLNPNAMNAIEIALASAFEGNVNAVIGFLRTWSLPIACSVAEIASLGGWLPAPEASPLPLGTLDADDFALLGVSQPANDAENIKDATLVMYARELAGIENLSPSRNGWEMAIQVLGRMDLPEKSEETVGELLRDLLATLDEHSSQTVDKMWRILNDLGMINFAEETAEVCLNHDHIWRHELT